QLRLSVGADGGNQTARAAEPRELGSVETDGSGRAGHPHIAPLERPVRIQREVGRHRWHTKACAQFERDPSRQRHGLGRRYAYILGGGAEWAAPLGVPGPHPFADAASIDSLADLVDLACPVAVRNNERVAWPVADAAPPVAIRRI